MLRDGYNSAGTMKGILLCVLHIQEQGWKSPPARFKQVSAMFIPHSGIELLRLTDAGDLLWKKKKIEVELFTIFQFNSTLFSLYIYIYSFSESFPL